MLTTFYVDSPADIVDPDDGVTSFREAVELANARPGRDVIQFRDAAWNATFPIDPATGGTFDLRDDVTIRGNNALSTGVSSMGYFPVERTVFSGRRVDRVFRVYPGVSVDIDRVSILSGLATDTSELGAVGGGILVDGGRLTLDRVSLSDNVASGDGTTTLNGGASGGAIFLTNDAVANITNSGFSDNVVRGADGRQGSENINGASATGGAIAVVNSSLRLDRVFVGTNFAAGGRGATAQFGQLAGNGGDAKGGAIYFKDAVSRVDDAYFRYNQAVGGAGGRGTGARGPLNTAASDGGDGGGASGGAIATENSRLTTFFTEVMANEAIGGRGGTGGSGINVAANLRDGANGGNGGEVQGAGLHLGTGVVTLWNTTVAQQVNQPGARGNAGSASVYSVHSEPGSPGSRGIDHGGAGVFVDGARLTGIASLFSQNVAMVNPDVSGAFFDARSVLISDSRGVTGVVDGVDANQLDVPARYGIDAALENASDARVGSNFGYDIGAREQEFFGDSSREEVTIIVNSLGDLPDVNLSDGISRDATGKSTLRSAIQTANARGGRFEYHIVFNIPGPGPHLIALQSELPVIVSTVHLDGSSEPNYSGTPVIQIDGGGVLGNGIQSRSDRSVIEALSITNFVGPGVNLRDQSATIPSFGNRVIGNYIGIDPDGNVAGNRLGIAADGDGHFIDENVISGNQAMGLRIRGDDVGVFGNFIGTDPSGNNPLGNGSHGILVHAFGAIIDQNVISGNQTSGVYFLDQDAESNRLSNNRIGTNADGTAAVGNGLGVVIRGPRNTLDRNLISGNTGDGVLISGFRSQFNKLIGNSIGVDAAANSAIPNGGNGVRVNRAVANFIGVQENSLSNLISGNTGNGVLIEQTSTANRVEENQIGTDEIGTVAVPNHGHGVLLTSRGTGQVIANNLISGNLLRGITLAGRSTAETTVRDNRIGTTVDGVSPLHNQSSNAVRVNDQAATIDGNVITSPGIGIAVTQANPNRVTGDVRVVGNWIGTDPDQAAVDLAMATGISVQDPLREVEITANVIANNQTGVSIPGRSTQTPVSENVFYGNGIAIDVGDAGPTENDFRDVDGDPGRLQNYPELILARKINANRIRFQYKVDTNRVSGAYPIRVEFYISDGNQQGRTFLGSDVVEQPDALTRRTVDFTDLPRSITVGEMITSLAIDAEGNTSEFGLQIAVQ